MHVVKERSQGPKLIRTLHPSKGREANQEREKQTLEGQETKRKTLTERKKNFEIVEVVVVGYSGKEF